MTLLVRAAEPGETAASAEAHDLFAARSSALAERVKELKCLQSISDMLLRGHSELGDILQKVVDALPSALQYPELGCARIKMKSRQYMTHDFSEPRWRHRADIVIGEESVATLELGYTEALADGSAPDFLEEERNLLSIVAHRVADIVALKEAQSQLATHQENLRSLASQLTLAEEHERRRLALVLHDRIGQRLAVAKLKIETLTSLLPAEHHERLDDLSALIKGIVTETRSLTFEISPPILYELGLGQAVIWLSESLNRQYGLRVEVFLDDEIRGLSEGVRVILFRAIQELLTNTVKHARASRAAVRLSNVGGEVSVIVEDDGIGIDPGCCARYPSAASGFGLFSIRERMGHLGGRMEVESEPGSGTRIRLSVPHGVSGNDNGQEGGQ
jgi:signal transduction histidine kinase